MDMETVNKVLQYLSPIVVNCQALVIDGKQAHWHVRGVNFIAVHKLLDKVVQHAQAYADAAAERVVALGLPVDARLATVAAKSTLPEIPDGFHNYDVMISQVVGQIDATLKVVRDAIGGLDDSDLSSQDVCIEIERGMVEDRWFLAAHLAGNQG
ncbi:DNA starvation/stationary phase protection protein [Amnibacterium sp. CER49]|uniref:Dps family protein n=1 Tax=Amnibacterium sp. CER49 TaxID=3039161 RepID=UPI00244C2321|nr:DNA starvation/stationary phase protection protein [Amnibacterium sp. CER49]MDH2442524.1 DNA starvation/stationary phase protection protein [Amnibacterium sp. CER49]